MISLKARRTVVAINEALSSNTLIVNGVPWGSVLRLLLVAKTHSSLLSALQATTVFSYADDTEAVQSARNQTQCLTWLLVQETMFRSMYMSPKRWQCAGE